MTAADRLLTAVWVVLVGATLTTGWLAENERGLHWAGAVIFLIASGKVALIVSHFMEVRFAPSPWKLIFAAWLCVVTTMVLAGAVLIA